MTACDRWASSRKALSAGPGPISSAPSAVPHQLCPISSAPSALLLELEPERERPRLELHPLLGHVVHDVYAGRRLDALQPLDLVAATLVEGAVDLQLAGLARRTDRIERGVAPVRELVLVEPLELDAH